MATVQIKEFEQIKQEFIDAIKVRVQENSGNSYNVSDYYIGGVLNTIVEAFSDVLEQFYFDLFQIAKESLENIYNGFNFYKIPGKKASCTVYVYFDTTNLGEAQNTLFLRLPQGTTVTTEDGSIQFELLDQYNASKLSIASSGEFAGKVVYTGFAASTSTGASNNVLANKLTKISSAITNINNYPYYVRNTSASGGADEESEENMKKRFQKYLVSLRRGTEEALSFALETNASFTGLLYAINKYQPLSIVRQNYVNSPSTPFTTSSGVYNSDLTGSNKFDLQYVLLTTDDFPVNGNPGTFYNTLYFGYQERFFNLLFVTAAVPFEKFQIAKVQFYNSDTKLWEDIPTETLNVTLPHYFTDNLYLYWDVPDRTKWGKIQILDYTAYFVRIMVQSYYNNVAAPGELTVLKTMTYPFPGYIDVYSLKNYRYTLNDADKVVISEAVEPYKAAGVITTIQDATVTQLYPLVILYTNDLTKSFIPSTIVEDMKADIVTYANSLDIGEDFDRNSFYAYMFNKYSQYGQVIVYFRYDGTINELPGSAIYKQAFRENLYDTSFGEKVDLLFSDIIVTQNLNQLVMTTVGWNGTTSSDSVDFTQTYAGLYDSNYY